MIISGLMSMGANTAVVGALSESSTDSSVVT